MEITLPSGGELVSLAKLDDVQADDFHHGAPARQRSVVDEPHPAARGDARDRPGVPRGAAEGERHPAPGRESRRRGDGLRAAEADADAHAARGPLQRARHGRRPRRSGCPIRCCRSRWCATKVWRDWLPDIYLNPHGYPSHEWVQQFAGYVPPGVPLLLVVARLVDADERAARSALSRTRARGRDDPRADRARSEQLSGRARDEPAASGALSALGVRLRALRVQPGDLQGHGDLLHRSGERPADAARGAPARATGGDGGRGPRRRWPRIRR